MRTYSDERVYKAKKTKSVQVYIVPHDVAIWDVDNGDCSKINVGFNNGVPRVEVFLGAEVIDYIGFPFITRSTKV